SSELRFKLCLDLWNQIKTETEALQDELHRNILDSLLEFTRKCSSTRQHSDWASQMRASEIPTAALVLGVNVPDHDLTFQSLSELLRDSVTPHVASLQAKECGGNGFRLLIWSLNSTAQILMGTVVDDDEEEEEEVQQPGSRRHHSVLCSLQALCDWYSSKTKARPPRGGTPGKKRSSAAVDEQHRQPPVVIIFKDLEAFNPRVLQDFILICSRYVQRLPLMFIFGIATAPSTIRHMLPNSVSSLLCIELFQSLSCTQHLTTVIDKLILTSNFPFKLSGRVMQVLVSIFLYHDFSVRNFIKGLQVRISRFQALYVRRRILNFHQYACVQRSVKSQAGNTWNDDTLALCRAELVLTTVVFLRMLAKDELISLLQKCAEVLQPVKSKQMKNARVQLEELLAKFKQLDGENIQHEDNLTSPVKDLQKKTDLFQLQKTLLEMNESRRSKRRSPFELLRNEAVEFIDSLVKNHLSPPESKPLYEVCYYSSSATVRRHLNATPRTSIQAALGRPYNYIQNDSLKAEDGTVSNAAPDICIAYKLHLECGRLINLYDWLEAYSTVVSAAEDGDPDSDGFGKVDEVKHARFIRAVSELEFLGFIKATRKKTDHVARLTWGGC
uniref:Origin recognition complex subunit 3 n=1 Tax=Fundulus heteroclitus TaxID=8078 RepID=A0A3Q2PFB7_FUNHE